MYQFFVEEEQIGREFITITGSDVNHIKNVLRMKAGEEIRVSNQNGKDYFCSILEVTEEFVQADILRVDENTTELPSKIYLFQGIPKGERMETIIEKAVELGVYEIIPVAMKYCVVKLDEKKAATKQKRWQAMAETAAKQSKRSIIPTVHSLMHYKEALNYARECDVKLLPYENALGMEKTRQVISKIKSGESISIFIGPEGGFSGEEIEAAKDMEIISLGKRILRTDTAGIALMSMLMLQIEMTERG